MRFYGWVGKNNSKKIGKRDKGTDTASYIKFFAKKIGACDASISEIKSKNLLERENSYYYVLSISNGKSSWAPYPFIYELAEKGASYMLLTIDGVEKGKGKIYKVELNDTKLKELDLSYVERDDAGDYYSLPLSKVKNITQPVEYQMKDENSENYIEKVLKELMQ